jgi:hypothetical protein
MIKVAEHVYHDDPGVGHPDVRTQLRDVRYYFIGNGLIVAAIQHAPAGEGSPYGLLLMDPQRLTMKRDCLSFDAATGIDRTMLTICDRASGSLLERSKVTACWDQDVVSPHVRVSWQAGDLDIAELFYCPDRSTPRLLREIHLRNRSSAHFGFALATGVRSQTLAQDLDLPPHGEVELFILYALERSIPTVRFHPEKERPSASESDLYWRQATQVSCASAPIDHLFRTAAAQLPAVISRSGSVDAGIWQYNREWVRDQSLVVHALLLCGHRQLARVMLERLLREFISAEGSAVDSSEVRANADAELDQNGALLHVLGEYVLWTGDLDIVRENWGRIVLTAEFPLQPCFREPVSGLMFNQRDFWERHSTYGIEPGIELMHQVYVATGLSAAAGLARQVRQPQESARWQAAAERIKAAVLHHPTHALVGEQGFIKRRGTDGSVQTYIMPKPDAGLPPEVGLARDIAHPLNPDSACALPIVLGFVSPEAEEAQRTLEQLEALWNQGWDTGGYGRYHMDSDPDSAGPWPFPSVYIARAYLECGRFDRVWRVLHWLTSLPQSASGSFFEMYGNRIAPPYAQNGIVPWNWSELIMLVVKNMLGFQPEEDAMNIRPRLLPGVDRAQGSIPCRSGRIFFSFTRDDGIDRPRFLSNGKVVETSGACVRIPFCGEDIHLEGKIPSACK